MSSQLLTDAELDLLVEVAEQSVHQAVHEHARWQPDTATYPPALRRPGAAFVTLERNARLLGCIGTLSADRPLVDTVADRARAAALSDPRVGPVRDSDLPWLSVSVSVLSPLRPMGVAGYDELVAALRPFVDGLVIDSHRYRATFLPAVWDTLPEAADFVAALWRKAGIAPHTWPSGAHASRYTAQHRSNHSNSRT